MKHSILVIVMGLFCLTGFTQNQNSYQPDKTFKYKATFPNGDEAITIIESSESNVLKLTKADNYYDYGVLELAKHEMVHKTVKKRKEGDIDKLKLVVENNSLNFFNSDIIISNKYGETISIVN